MYPALVKENVDSLAKPAKWRLWRWHNIRHGAVIYRH